MRCKAEYQLTIVRGYEYICYYWGNYDLIGETYALSCPANKYHSLSDSCISCDQMWAGYIEKGSENIERILAYSWGVLALDNHAGLSDYPSQLFYVRDHFNTCAKCPNRDLVGDTCVLK